MTNPDPDIDHQFDEPDPAADADESQSADLNERYADHTKDSTFSKK
jgi:hypothetical protein